MKKTLKGTKALVWLLAAAMVLLLMPISAFAGGDGIAGLTITIRDSQTPVRFTLKPENLTGNFVFTNAQGDSFEIPPSLFYAQSDELKAYSFFVTENAGGSAILVKSPGAYAITKYSTLPQSYSFITAGEPQLFILSDLEPYQGTDAFFLYVNNGDEPETPVQPIAEVPSSWAAEQVSTAVEAGIVPDFLQSKFTTATTRAEFCSLAVALYETVKGAEITERTQFSDTTDVNVEKMAALGVVNGVGDGNFSPDDSLTREQAATMLARLATAIGKPLPTVDAPPFNDNADISDWAIEAVGQMQATGIMNGLGDNTFSPLTDYIREQSIVTMMRLFNFVK